MTVFKLSPTQINLFLDCPRCFWMAQVKKIRRPRGIFPSLPGGMDRVIKTYFDQFRAEKALPPELQTKDLEGVTLYDNQEKLERWRSWKMTDLVYKDTNGSTLSGALDDLLMKDGKAIPFDYKTKGSPTDEASAVKYYQTQLDCYALMLEAKGFETLGVGYLLFYSPKTVDSHDLVRFEVQAIKISTSVERAKNHFRDAVALLQGPLVASSDRCEYCAWLRNFKTPFK